MTFRFNGSNIHDTVNDISMIVSELFYTNNMTFKVNGSNIHDTVNNISMYNVLTDNNNVN